MQALQRLTHPDLRDVPRAVEEERVPPELFAGGADSIRVRLTPRTASSVRTASTAPTRSWEM
jgi:hypothetical protein